MTDHEDLMKRCQRGATNLNDANNLLAECYGLLGKLGAEISRLKDVAHGFCDELHAAGIENNELKLANDALRYDIAVANSVVSTERKDAERYRWNSIEGNWVARMFGKWRAHIGEYGDSQPTDWYPSREEAIDAAMSKEG